MGLLEGRVELITGASRGIGRAMSERFAREGAAVVCVARSADQMKETAAGISATGARAIAIVCDAGVEGDVRRRVAIAVKGFGKLDTLVNNAGDAGPTKAVQRYLVEDRRMALELAPHNIRVNCVAPGAVEGERIDRVIASQVAARGVAIEQMCKAALDHGPLKADGYCQ
jgi:NAD(P)-dependent dehydrogenase (short-subunit alcohol dehydrogenase family)